MSQAEKNQAHRKQITEAAKAKGYEVIYERSNAGKRTFRFQRDGKNVATFHTFADADRFLESK